MSARDLAQRFYSSVKAAAKEWRAWEESEPNLDQTVESTRCEYWSHLVNEPHPYQPILCNAQHPDRPEVRCQLMPGHRHTHETVDGVKWKDYLDQTVESTRWLTIGSTSSHDGSARIQSDKAWQR